MASLLRDAAAPAVDNEEAWRERLRRSGHTGWNDPVVYAWDQLDRLRLVEEVVRGLELDPATSTALDFGCGVGDFSRMLLRLGFRVVGHDPVTRPTIRHPRFGFERVLEADPHGVDLVLSVTVLDHILDDERVRATLAALRQRLRTGGHLVMLEYSLAGACLDDPRLRANGHQAFRSRSAWLEILAASGFAWQGERPVPHPECAPSRGYERYARDPFVRAVARTGLGASRLGRALLAARAHRFARRETAPDTVGPSPLVCATLRAR